MCFKLCLFSVFFTEMFVKIAAVKQGDNKADNRAN